MKKESARKDITEEDIKVGMTFKKQEQSTQASERGHNDDGKQFGPLISQSKSKLTERDLLMMCVDQPHYLAKALGHDNSEGTGLHTLDQKKEMLKYFYKAWSGLVKFIYSQCALKGKCVDFPLVGRFIAR